MLQSKDWDALATFGQLTTYTPRNTKFGVALIYVRFLESRYNGEL